MHLLLKREIPISSSLPSPLFLFSRWFCIYSSICQSFRCLFFSIYLPTRPTLVHVHCLTLEFNPLFFFLQSLIKQPLSFFNLSILSIESPLFCSLSIKRLVVLQQIDRFFNMSYFLWLSRSSLSLSDPLFFNLSSTIFALQSVNLLVPSLFFNLPKYPVTLFVLQFVSLSLYHNLFILKSFCLSL